MKTKGNDKLSFLSRWDLDQKKTLYLQPAGLQWLACLCFLFCSTVRVLTGTRKTQYFTPVLQCKPNWLLIDNTFLMCLTKMSASWTSRTSCKKWNKGQSDVSDSMKPFKTTGWWSDRATNSELHKTKAKFRVKVVFLFFLFYHFQNTDQTF